MYIFSKKQKIRQEEILQKLPADSQEKPRCNVEKNMYNEGIEDAPEAYLSLIEGVEPL